MTVTADNPYNDKILPYAELIASILSGTFLHNYDTLVVASRFNSRGRRDATGAFHIGAKRFCDYHSLDRRRTEYIDNSVPFADRAKELLSVMVDGAPRQVYVMFCHGFVNGIQFGVKSPTPGHAFTETDALVWNMFCDVIARHVAPVVVLFACSTGSDIEDDPNSAPGSGDNSFGDLLRDELCQRGCLHNRVVTHFTAGHSWGNPNIRILDGFGRPTGDIGGLPLVPDNSMLERKLGRELRRDSSKFAWKYPFMEVADIVASIEGWSTP